VLEVKSISKSYQRYQACKEIDLTFKQGKIVGLFGANGAGKSTCFHIITGLIKPDSGTITINNLDITHKPLHQRATHGISYLPQDSSIFQSLTVEQNILAVLELSKIDTKERKNRLESLIDKFSLSKVRHTQGSLLSGGERRRTEVARAMANHPQFLLLDEPFSGVDPIAVHEIKVLLQNIQKELQVGIIITDHNVAATLPMCDYAYIMHLGEVLTQGSPEQVRNCPVAKKYYLGDSLETAIIE
jgi:lipopolysaccharide export system ATP-binding protein